MMGRQISWWLALGALVSSMALAVPTDASAQTRRAPAAQTAQSRPAAVGKVEVEVLVVHATDNGQVDPQLVNLMQNFKRAGYTGFDLMSTEKASLATGKETVISLPGERRLRVTVLERTATQAKVRLRIMKDGNKILDTTVSIPDGRYFMIAGPKYKGGALILPVRVKL